MKQTTEELEGMVIGFGKYEGKCLGEIPSHYLDYVFRGARVVRNGRVELDPEFLSAEAKYLRPFVACLLGRRRGMPDPEGEYDIDPKFKWTPYTLAKKNGDLPPMDNESLRQRVRELEIRVGQLQEEIIILESVNATLKNAS